MQEEKGACKGTRSPVELPAGPTDWRSYLMVRFSRTSGKPSSSSLSSSKVMEPLWSLSAASKRAKVRSPSRSSGRAIALSRRHQPSTTRSSSGSMEPLPAEVRAGTLICRCTLTTPWFYLHLAPLIQKLPPFNAEIARRLLGRKLCVARAGPYHCS